MSDNASALLPIPRHRDLVARELREAYRHRAGLIDALTDIINVQIPSRIMVVEEGGAYRMLPVNYDVPDYLRHELWLNAKRIAELERELYDLTPRRESCASLRLRSRRVVDL